MQPYEYWKKSPTLDLVFTTFLWSLPKFPYVSIEWAAWRWDHMTSWASHDALVMVVPMEQWAGQPFQDKSADLWVVMLSDHNEKYSDRMERSYKAFAVTFELRLPFPLSYSWIFGIVTWNSLAKVWVTILRTPPQKTTSHVVVIDKASLDQWYYATALGVAPWRSTMLCNPITLTVTINSMETF